MSLGKQLFGYKRSEVDQYLQTKANEEQEQLAELDERLNECRFNIQSMLTQIDRMMLDLDTYSSHDRAIADRVWDQVKALEEVRHVVGLQIKATVELTGDKVERLQDFYNLLDRIRSQIGGLSCQLAEAGRFGSPTRDYPRDTSQVGERGRQIGF